MGISLLNCSKGSIKMLKFIILASLAALTAAEADPQFLFGYPGSVQSFVGYNPWTTYSVGPVYTSYGKREAEAEPEAEAEAEADALYTAYGYGRGYSAYSWPSYAGYSSYSRPFYGGYSTFSRPVYGGYSGYYGKREADAEPKAD